MDRFSGQHFPLLLFLKIHRGLLEAVTGFQLRPESFLSPKCPPFTSNYFTLLQQRNLAGFRHSLIHRKIPLTILQCKLSTTSGVAFNELLNSVTACYQLYTLEEISTMIRVIAIEGKKHGGRSVVHYDKMTNSTEESTKRSIAVQYESIESSANKSRNPNNNSEGPKNKSKSPKAGSKNERRDIMISQTLNQLCDHLINHLYVLTDPNEFLEIAFNIVSSGYSHAPLIEQILERLDHFFSLNKITTPKQILVCASLLANMGTDLSILNEDRSILNEDRSILSTSMAHLSALEEQSSQKVPTQLPTSLRCYPPFLIRPIAAQTGNVSFNARTAHLSEVVARKLSSKLSSHPLLKSVNPQGLIQILRDLAWINYSPIPAVPAIGEY